MGLSAGLKSGHWIRQTCRDSRLTDLGSTEYIFKVEIQVPLITLVVQDESDAVEIREHRRKEQIRKIGRAAMNTYKSDCVSSATRRLLSS